MQYEDGYKDMNEAGRRAAKASKRTKDVWYVVRENGAYHVLSELEAFDLWCIHENQIIATYWDGEYQDE